jgi:hypothetical protein
VAGQAKTFGDTAVNGGNAGAGVDKEAEAVGASDAALSDDEVAVVDFELGLGTAEAKTGPKVPKLSARRRERVAKRDFDDFDAMALPQPQWRWHRNLPERRGSTIAGA